MSDRYLNFAHLAKDHVEGVDFQVRVQRRAAPVVVVAPHGGHIEPTTSQIATAIAADDSNLYCFEALKRSNAADLHITSTNFDEPRFVELVAGCEIAVSVHGLAAKKLDNADVLVGGRDVLLRDAICKFLAEAKYRASGVVEGEFSGTHPRNLCNRTTSGSGVQLEICRNLRDALARDAKELTRFTGAIRRAVTSVREARAAVTKYRN